MKKTHILLSLGIAFLALFSCQNEGKETESITDTDTQNIIEEKGVSLEQANKLQQLGFDLDNLERIEIESANNETEEVWANDDVFVSDYQLEELDSWGLISEDDEDAKAFIRNGRISTNQGSVFNGIRFVSIGFTVSRSSTTGRVVPKTAAERRALQRAVNTINNIGLRLFFVIQPDGVNNEVNVAGSIGGFIDGAAGIPTNGNFNRSFITASAPNEREFGAVIMHELMHAMGYRHSDFRTRRSCQIAGQPRQVFDENSRSPIDENFVAGTAFNGNFTNSIMTACYIGNFNLTREDVNAIRSIYGR